MDYENIRSYIKKFNIYHQNLIQIITNNGNFTLAEARIIVKSKEINALRNTNINILSVKNL